MTPAPRKTLLAKTAAAAKTTKSIKPAAPSDGIETTKTTPSEQPSKAVKKRSSSGVYQVSTGVGRTEFSRELQHNKINNNKKKAILRPLGVMLYCCHPIKYI